ncbi:hypothetical protein WNY59_07930 [Ahrensia kielensis]|uniref:Beta protein n=1 Tax=Ahrensia kielensis TaxID=76980 RepID=A0ABU9T5X0_9HYPH
MLNYIPVLKTSDAELRALKFVNDEIKRKILPVFELTRSRKTKRLPNGSAIRRLEQVAEIYKNYPYILDICTEPDLMNDEMIDFFDQEAGYKNWRNFLNFATAGQTIPCVLYDEDGNRENFLQQVQFIYERFGQLCIRGSYSDAEIVRKLLNWTSEIVPPDRIIIGGSVYFIPQGMLPNYEAMATQFLNDAIGNIAPRIVFVTSSSFPKSVGTGAYGEDDAGTFPFIEMSLTQNLKMGFPNLPLIHSDYASVHPIRYQTKAYNWVPRIDAILDGNYTYTRLRQDDGGYSLAAKILYAKHNSELVDCWGTSQIREAAIDNKLGGRSPSFWISSRINQWITRAAA